MKSTPTSTRSFWSLLPKESAKRQQLHRLSDVKTQTTKNVWCNTNSDSKVSDARPDWNKKRTSNLLSTQTPVQSKNTKPKKSSTLIVVRQKNKQKIWFLYKAEEVLQAQNKNQKEKDEAEEVLHA